MEENHLNHLKRIKAYVENFWELEENLTIETVTEDLRIKKEVISKLSFKDNIFSNTSSIKLSQIGENINGFHFMNPITIPLIELCKRKQYFKIYIIHFKF